MMFAYGADCVRTFVRFLMRGWRSWMPRNSTVAELSRLGSGEIERVAHDLGVNSRKLRIIAGKWPDSTELLSRRLAALKLDEHKLREKAPQVLRDIRVDLHQEQCRVAVPIAHILALF